jgi:hypothetical protein
MGVSQFGRLALIPHPLLPTRTKRNKTSPSPHLGDLGEGFRVRVIKMGMLSITIESVLASPDRSFLVLRGELKSRDWSPYSTEFEFLRRVRLSDHPSGISH